MSEEHKGAPEGEHVDSPSTPEDQTGNAPTDSQPSKENGKSVPYDRFKEVNDTKKRYEEKYGPLDDNGDPVTKPQPKDDDLSKDVASLKEKNAKADFRDEHSLSREQVEWLWSRTGGNPTEDDLNDPGIKAALSALDRKASVDDNTPSSGRGAPTYNGKTWAEIAKDPNVSDAEKQKAYDSLTNSKAGRR